MTSCDQWRLEQLFDSGFAESLNSKNYLADLRAELLRSQVVEPSQMPPDVVTMNSTVRLRDMDTGDLETYTLVYPHEANISESKLSILAPIGTAIIGNRVGDIVRWRVPIGTRRLQIDEVLYQPERDEVLRVESGSVPGH